jgi:hypothetical protein
VVLGLLITLFVVKGLVPGWRKLNTDFPNYYLAASLHHRGIPLDHAYDWVWFQRQKDHAGIDWGVVGYVPLSPFSALVLEPFVALPPLAAKHAWLSVNVVLLAATIGLLRAMTRVSARRLAILTFLTVIPLQTAFQFGQQYVAVLFLLALAGWLYLRERDPACGAVLAVASALKLYPALFAVFFLVKRRWSALAGLCVTGGLLTLLGLVWFGAETLRSYAVEILPRALAGEGNDPYYAGFNTPAVLLRRLFVAEPELNPHPLVHAPAAFVILEPTIAALTLVSALWFMPRTGRRDDPRRALEWGAFVALLLVLSTSSSTYHFCPLILATALAADFLLGEKRIGTAAALVGLHVLVCAPLNRLALPAPSGWSIFLGVPRLYALLGYWGLLLSVLARVDPPPARRARDVRWYAVAFGALALYGIGSTARHYAGQMQMDEARERVAMTDGALVANGPAPAAGSVYYSRMADEGYVLDRTGSGLVTRTVRGVDLFHPTLAPQLGVGWVEVSSRRSRIARFGLDAPALSATELPTELEDAEQPTVSADARWLGFIREDGGRGTLWVAQAAPSHGSETFARDTEVELAGPSYDVREFAFFPDGRLVMASSTASGPRLFVTGPAPGPIVALPTSVPRARYPAVSPDGRWLAYCGQEHGAWQLRLMDLLTHGEERLTHADCNAIAPAWTADSASLVYASDCGRNIGNTALFRVRVAPRSNDYGHPPGAGPNSSTR